MSSFHPEPLEKLKTYPVFQVLRAKAETHALKFRPKESANLKRQGKFDAVLDERTRSAWNILAQCRKDGLDLDQAEEFALPLILLPDEKREELTEEL